MLALLLSVIPSVFSIGYVYLPNDLIFAWRFESEDTIKFEFRIPHTTTVPEDWAVIGFVIDAVSDPNTADLAYVWFDRNSVTDSYREEGSDFVSDVTIGGNNDFTDVSYKFSAKKMTYYWTRKLDTGDVYDVVLVKDQEYEVVYIVGTFGENGEKIENDDYKGTIQIVLGEDYHDTTLKAEFLQFNQ
jgi:hypothetical protein